MREIRLKTTLDQRGILKEWILASGVISKKFKEVGFTEEKVPKGVVNQFVRKWLDKNKGFSSVPKCVLAGACHFTASGSFRERFCSAHQTHVADCNDFIVEIYGLGAVSTTRLCGSDRYSKMEIELNEDDEFILTVRKK